MALQSYCGAGNGRSELPAAVHCIIMIGTRERISQSLRHSLPREDTWNQGWGNPVCAGWLSGNSKEGVAWLDIDMGSCILDLSGMPFFPAKEDRSLESGFPGGSYSKESTCNAKDLDSVAGSEKSPGEGNGNLLQYSSLENPMDRGAWWASVHDVAELAVTEQLTHRAGSRPLLWTASMPTYVTGIAGVTWLISGNAVSGTQASDPNPMSFWCSQKACRQAWVLTVRTCAFHLSPGFPILPCSDWATCLEVSPTLLVNPFLIINLISSFLVK